MVMGELEQTAQVLVIGGGPAGYTAALRAADLGFEVTVVDPAPRPGGHYLHSGCIPAKFLLHLAQVMAEAENLRSMGVIFAPPHIDLEAIRRFRSGLIEDLAGTLTRSCRRRDIQLVQAAARFEDSHGVRLEGGDIRRIRFEHAVIATGARPAAMPGTPFTDGGRVMSPGAALELADIPHNLLVVGSGSIALELGTLYAALGSRVSLVTLGQRLLPGVDADLVAPLQRCLERLFASIDLHSKIAALHEHGSGIQAVFEQGPAAEKHFDRALVAVGARPATRDLGLERTRVAIDADGFIRVDPQQRTSDPAIWAAGDVTGGWMLAHKAAREGKVAAETIAGEPSAFDPRAIPSVVYTDPQLAWCGLTEEDALQRKSATRVLRCDWHLSSRAATLGAPQGLTKIVVDAQSGRILGAGIVGRQAEALIAEAVLAIEMGALAEDLALALHPHPTLSETAGAAAALFLAAAAVGDQDLPGPE